ncbi:eukaryotic translation elongation factor 1 epsilon-1 isoform X1 [Apteryx mantelli]|uniref:Eukaryotic translation elongation factor 1 epsilon-1 isoform X1 n=1 Tax=Apteryx mantelli TaxID=2696672 RepID=A0A8B7IG11_9AVES|nr:PREDICTED: eukaryotic translation elongation factor 1 epsilon-1 isoform X1 [Apteryx mantelli mantelli]
MAAAAQPGLGAEELALLEKSLGLQKGNKYGVQGERKIPVLQTNNGPSLIGLITVAAHLVKQAKKEQLLGSTAEEKAVVQQWLEYRVTRVDGCSSEEDTRIILKDLNAYLEDKVYLAGNSFTLADILMYYGLHPVMFECAWGKKPYPYTFNAHLEIQNSHLACEARAPARLTLQCKKRRNTLMCLAGSTTFNIIQVSDNICLMSSLSRIDYILMLIKENFNVILKE